MWRIEEEGRVNLDIVFLIISLLLGILAAYWRYKSEYYRGLAKDFSCKYSTLEYEVKFLRRKYEELNGLQSGRE